MDPNQETIAMYRLGGMSFFGIHYWQNEDWYAGRHQWEPRSLRLGYVIGAQGELLKERSQSEDPRAQLEALLLDRDLAQLVMTRLIMRDVPDYALIEQLQYGERETAWNVTARYLEFYKSLGGTV